MKFETLIGDTVGGLSLYALWIFFTFLLKWVINYGLITPITSGMNKQCLLEIKQLKQLHFNIFLLTIRWKYQQDRKP